jgi:uncharacterized protein DUF4258
MAERGISTRDVEEVLDGGDTIEDYPDDMPYPSRLVLARPGGKALHVVAADDDAGRTIVISAYEPDPDRWDEEFRNRR